MPLYLDGPVIRHGEALEDFDTPFRTYLRAKYRDAIDNNVTPLLGEYERVAAESRAPMLDPGMPDAGIEPTFGPAPAKLDAETARARVKEANVRLDVPDDGIPQGALDILIARRKRQKAYDDAIARSPTGMRSVAGIGMSFVGALLDPLNVASAFVPVVREARYSLMLARASGAMGRAGVRAGVGAIEGLAGAAMLEPFAYAAHQGLQDDYKALDSVVNIGFGGLLGGGLHVAGGAVRDVFSPGPWKNIAEAEADAAATTRAIASHYADETATIQRQEAEHATALDRILYPPEARARPVATSAVLSSADLAEVPLYQGNKRSFFSGFAPFLAKEQRLFSGRTEIFDAFGGGGGYGLFLANHFAPDVKRVVVNEIDPARAAKLQWTAEKGHTLPQLFQRANVAATVDLLAQIRGGGSAVEKGASIAARGEAFAASATANAGIYSRLAEIWRALDDTDRIALQSLIDVSYAKRAAHNDVHSVMASAIENAANYHRAAQRFKARGGSLEYVVGDGFAAERYPENGIVVLDPPYYGTTGYRSASPGEGRVAEHAGFDFLAMSSKSMQAAADRGNTVLYHNSNRPEVAQAISPLADVLRTWARTNAGVLDELFGVKYGSTTDRTGSRGGGANAEGNQRDGGSGDAGSTAAGASGEAAPGGYQPGSAAGTVGVATHVQRETALRTAVAQAVDGRAVDVGPIFDPNVDLGAALHRGPESERLSDPDTSRATDERLSAAPKSNDLKAAEAALAQEMQALEARWAATGRDPAALKAMAPELDAMTKQADELARAARAAAVCDVGGA